MKKGGWSCCSGCVDDGGVAVVVPGLGGRRCDACSLELSSFVLGPQSGHHVVPVLLLFGIEFVPCWRVGISVVVVVVVEVGFQIRLLHVGVVQFFGGLGWRWIGGLEADVALVDGAGEGGDGDGDLVGRHVANPVGIVGERVALRAVSDVMEAPSGSVKGNAEGH